MARAMIGLRAPASVGVDRPVRRRGACACPPNGGATAALGPCVGAGASVWAIEYGGPPMPLEPVSREFVDAYLASGELPVQESSPGIARLGEIVMAGVSGPGPEVGSVENRKIAGPAGDFRIRV